VSYDYVEKLTGVIADQIAPNATQVDAEGRYPKANIEALRSSGLFGLISSTDVGGEGAGIRAASDVVREIAKHCASTAMITCMHYAAVAVIEATANMQEIRRAIADNRHVSTLAFSESGSRSHFWAPVSTARRSSSDANVVELDAKKSWVTGASYSDSFVWSSRPLEAEGASSLWLVPSTTDALFIENEFDGLGLRGNGSVPVSAVRAQIPAVNLLGVDGGGFDLMMGVVLPFFNLMNASMSIGLMDACVNQTAAHLKSTRMEHLDTSLAENPVTRLHLARARVKADAAKALVDAAVTAVEAGAPDAMLYVLESKAVAGDSAIEVTDLCMRAAGGAAFRKELGVERNFRDARAAAVMAPTSDILYDFVGKAITDIPLF
jgi:alkylation response protein AidB-like acyl-CoA dehydrogenase